jgi:ketosteroid isomerase-like protein
VTVQRALATLVVLLALWFGWRYFFPDDEAQIRGVLDRVADAVTSDEGEVARIARAASMRNELDPQVAVDAGPPFSTIAGREALVAAVARLNSTVRDLDVQLEDVQVTVAPDRATARVSLTAEAHFRDEGGGPALEARELDVMFRRRDGDWVVSEVALVRALDPVSPR